PSRRAGRDLTLSVRRSADVPAVAVLVQPDRVHLGCAGGRGHLNRHRTGVAPVHVVDPEPGDLVAGRPVRAAHDRHELLTGVLLTSGRAERVVRRVVLLGLEVAQVRVGGLAFGCAGVGDGPVDRVPADGTAHAAHGQYAQHDDQDGLSGAPTAPG